MGKIFGAANIVVLLAATQVQGAGYRIPQQSVNSVALSGAYVASTPAADASYFNPANMSWLDDRTYFEGNLMYIGLPETTYKDNRSSLFNGVSEVEHFLIPTFFAVSPSYRNFRIGLSFVAPGGLSKRWNDPYPRTFSEEFTLNVLELSSSISYAVGELLSLAAGVRTFYADGKVKANGMISREYGGVRASMDMEGEAWEYGYNLAATVRPTKELSLSATYRSNVDLNLEGNAALSTTASFAGKSVYNGDADTVVPLPAVLALAVSYTFMDSLTVEIEWDRTYWSEYEQVDFNFGSAPLGNPFLYGAFDAPKDKNWEDIDAWRIGFSYDINQSFTVMAGFAIDESPIPESAQGFELPESAHQAYSIGLRYRASQDLEIGVAYLYDHSDSHSESNDILNGTFEGGGAHLLSVGVSYKL